MTTATGKTSDQLLDEVQQRAQLEAFSPEQYIETLREELAADPGRLPAALAAIDRFTGRSMRIRLDLALAGETALPSSFRTYLVNMVTSYEGELDTLRARVAGVARSDATADAVVEAAAGALADRARLRAAVLALVPPPPDEEPAADPVPPTREELIELD